jgi:hypothetical protein
MREPVLLEEWADQRVRESADKLMDLPDMSSSLAFGSNGLLDIRTMDNKLDKERAEMFPGHPASIGQEFAGTQIAQGWNGIPRCRRLARLHRPAVMI